MKKFIKTLIIVTLLFLNTSIIKAAQYIWPIHEGNANETKIEYGYGPRNYDWQSYDNQYNYGTKELPYSNKTENHYGVDIIGIKGNTYDVVSVANGKVLTTSLDQAYKPGLKYIDRNQRDSSFDGGGYGNYIVIEEEGTGLCFLYAHLKADSVKLRNGDKVTVGQVIGTMGSSGDSGHMHLHFEVRRNRLSTTYGFNLVITTGYGKETLNPVDYIGNEAPKKIEEPKEEKQEQENNEHPQEAISSEVIERKNITAKIEDVTIERNATYAKINIEFNKSVDFVEIPTLEVKVKTETKQANYISSTSGKTHTYVIKYNSFDPTTYGYIYATLKDGKIVDSDTKENIKFGVNNRYLGSLDPVTIQYTFDDAQTNKKGDVNNDGIIDARDASLVLGLYSKISTDKPLTQLEQEQLSRSDINDDGYVNAIDASSILTYYAKQSVDEGDIKQRNIIKCDLNNDHKITIADYDWLISGINREYEEKYDLNGDNQLNSSDVEFFKNILRENGQR